MRRLREVRRCGFGLIVSLTVVGCGSSYDQSSKPSFKRNLIGRELIAVEPATISLQPDARKPIRRDPPTTLPVGTRVRIVKAIYHPEFFLNPERKLVFGRIVGRETAGFVGIGRYALGPTRLIADRVGLLLLPKVAPSWLDVSTVPPCARSADIATLRAATLDDADDAGPFAARELVRRVIDLSRDDRLAARDTVCAVWNAVPSKDRIGRVAAAAVALPEPERSAFFSAVEPILAPRPR